MTTAGQQNLVSSQYPGSFIAANQKHRDYCPEPNFAYLDPTSIRVLLSTPDPYIFLRERNPVRVLQL